MLNLKLSTVPVHLHDIINIVNQNALSCKHVLIIFYRENMTSFLNYVKATLRTLYAWCGSYYTTIGNSLILAEQDILNPYRTVVIPSSDLQNAGGLSHIFLDKSAVRVVDEVRRVLVTDDHHGYRSALRRLPTCTVTQSYHQLWET